MYLVLIIVFCFFCFLELLKTISYDYGAYIWEEENFNLQSVKLSFLYFFQYKATILAFSRRVRYEIGFWSTIKTPEYVKLTIKLKIKIH